VKARRLTAVGVTLVLAAAGAAPATASAPPGVTFSRVTVTAAASGHRSAVVMYIDNRTGGPISLMSVTSPVSGTAMIYYDDNMCQPSNTMMTALSNILISAGHVQELGYRYQGAMLGGLRQTLVKGSSVPLVVRWTNFQRVKTVTVTAKVVAPPKGLEFHMSPMAMKM
jgi:copper(I)-binding protein